MSDSDVSELLDFAVEIVEAAGPIALRYFRAPLEVQNKMKSGGFDPVTRADHEVEAYLRQRIHERFPDHSITGEEGETHHGSSPLRWIIDPIDGTRAFISGAVKWGTLLGLTRDDQPIAGAVHAPYLHETFYGSSAGAWMRHREEQRWLQVRATTRLSDAILYCTHPDTFTTDHDRAGFARASARCRMLRYGGDCYSYCQMALGQVDLIIEGSLQPYDIIPIIPILEAAGAVVTDARGGSAVHGGVIVAAATAELHREALAAMKGDSHG